MKKLSLWATLIAFLVFVIDWGILGVNLSQGNYDLEVYCYIAFLCLAVMAAGCLYKVFSSRCPHCKKLRISGGTYCPYCGKQIE